MERTAVTVTTDGACKGNPGPGGWAAILRYGETEKILAGYDGATTNNKMELRAVIEAVKALKRPCIITLRTDSTYVANGIINAKENYDRCWRTKSGQIMKNLELWQELTEAKVAGGHKFSVVHVKGHNGDKDNERCDFAAKEQIALNYKEV